MPLKSTPLNINNAVAKARPMAIPDIRQTALNHKGEYCLGINSKELDMSCHQFPYSRPTDLRGVKGSMKRFAAHNANSRGKG